MHVNALIVKHEQDSALSRGEIQQLRDIAELCPYYDGIAVYYARTLWSDLGGYMLANNCEKINDNTNSGKPFIREKALETTATAFTIFPNPSSGVVKLTYQVDEGQNVNFRIYDVLGKLAAERRLTENSTQSINLEELQQGIYFYRLTKDGAVHEHGKLVIE